MTYFVRSTGRGERAIGTRETEQSAATESELVAAELSNEQAHVSVLYEHLDEMREQAAAGFANAIGGQTVGTPGSRSEREAFVRLYADRVSQLQAVEARLCFGRLDLIEGSRRYVGRIGISDADRVELLVDWRAPAAEPFYQATAAHPQDVIRRRQLSSRGRRVTGVQDEVLDLAAFSERGVDGGHVVLGEGALFASLEAVRSGRMNDIVATIQADQDRAIRAPLEGVFVVQGGPGTGKTAVALHRTAFLLYAHRARITRSGVLLVGPNRVFLRYIEQVLPALGEADAVVMVTPGQLYPGVSTDRADDPDVAALKGDQRMAEVIAAAVRSRQRPLEQTKRIEIDGTVITLYPRDIRLARDRARRSGDPHNQARVGFVADVLRELVRRLAAARGTELDADTRANLMAELHESRDVRRELNLCWPPISPFKLVRDLYANPAYRAACTPGWTAAERARLQRERSAPWTVSDVGLLDEAAELLGPDDSVDQSDLDRAQAEDQAEVAYADLVQDTFGGKDFISAAALADRYRSELALGAVAERAAADRQWSFGHIVVDEAQELSPMMWRILMRRSPSRSMTLVGDVAQTGSLAGADSWAQVLSPHVGDRFNQAELTVNYRTPEQIMRVAAAVMRAAGKQVSPPQSARVGRFEPEYTQLEAALTELGQSERLVEVVRSEWQLAGEGTVAVITSRADHAAVAARISAALPAGVVVSDSGSAASPVSVLGVADAKGLEFDTVVLVEPAAILAESARGVNDLYVALTRPTQRLHVLYVSELPAGMG
ncbi:MAG: ATP-dependent helicase [Frankiales bacterium]|nr:ATP-dependent helicase [Frankiales bacterium]